MRLKKLKSFLPSLLSLAMANSAAQFATQVPSETVPASAPEAREVAGVPYLNGGVGEEERRQMQTQAAQYPLHIVFSSRGGEYAVADAVTIWGPKRDRFTIHKAGPLLMLRLPPGSYTVQATFGTVAQQRSVALGPAVLKVNWTAPAPL